jgi:hypothetical protein
MTGVLTMLMGISDYLGSAEVTNRERLGVPLQRLFSAIVDLSHGRAPALLQPAIALGSRPPKSTAENVLMATAALAADKLIAGGAKRDEAARKVREALMARKQPINCEAKTILGWRDRLNEGQGRVPENALARFRSPLPPEAGSAPAEQAAWLLELLRISPVLGF